MVVGFQLCPKESHATSVKRIFRYLKGTSKFGLWYPNDQFFYLLAQTDANWEGSLDDKKSTSGNTFFLGNCLIAWSRRKQSSISLSTIEDGYITTAECCTQILWLRQCLEDIQVNRIQPTPIYVTIPVISVSLKIQLCTKKLSISQSSTILFEKKSVKKR